MKKWIRLTAPLVLMLLAACQSDYTQEAMYRAREFALENTRLLPETARAHIRYTTPELQYIPVFEHKPLQLTEYAHLPRNVDYSPRRNSDLDMIVSQFVWTPPRLGYSIIAIGHSRRNMEYWEPRKVILKNTAPYQKFYELALKAAVSYVTNKMLYLSNLERLRVRTTEAEVRETSFDLEYMFEEQLQSSNTEWQIYVMSLRERLKRRQYSLVWRTDDNNRRIVITGFGSVADLERWSPVCGMVIPAAQLDEYTVDIFRKGPNENGAVERLKHASDDKNEPVKENKPAEKTEPAKENKPMEKNGSVPEKPQPSEKAKP